jgi:2-polyprenyl-6-methoxyphenol hydroxylase-like FAD-dependent oxidoreductase
MTVSPRRALIIGGSLGGLFAGHLLRQSGWEVTIFERSAGDLADRGAGLGISAELLDVMRRIGLRISRSLAFEVRGSIWLDQKGKIAFESPKGANGSAWSIIYQPVRAAFPSESYRTGMTLTRVEQDSEGVIAHFADGTSERGALLVAADGIFSTVRRQFLSGTEPRSAGYIAWRGLLEEKDLPPTIPKFMLERCAFSFPEGEMVVSLPVPGVGNNTKPGHRRYYFIWYQSADAEKQRALFTDASGRSHGVSIPPALIRPEFLAEMRAAARANLSPVLAEIVTRAPLPLLQSIADMEAPQLVFGRVALLGDSAFVARPHVVAGATKAALDAKCLADALNAYRDDIDDALARYERERREFGRAIVAHSRYLGTYLEAQLKPVSERRGAELDRDPRQLIRDYGAPHLVHDIDFAQLDD